MSLAGSFLPNGQMRLSVDLLALLCLEVPLSAPLELRNLFPKSSWRIRNSTLYSHLPVELTSPNLTLSENVTKKACLTGEAVEESPIYCHISICLLNDIRKQINYPSHPVRELTQDRGNILINECIKNNVFTDKYLELPHNTDKYITACMYGIYSLNVTAAMMFLKGKASPDSFGYILGLIDCRQNDIWNRSLLPFTVEYPIRTILTSYPGSFSYTMACIQEKRLDLLKIAPDAYDTDGQVAALITSNIYLEKFASHFKEEHIQVVYESFATEWLRVVTHHPQQCEIPPTIVAIGWAAQRGPLFLEMTHNRIGDDGLSLFPRYDNNLMSLLFSETGYFTALPFGALTSFANIQHIEIAFLLGRYDVFNGNITVTDETTNLFRSVVQNLELHQLLPLIHDIPGAIAATGGRVWENLLLAAAVQNVLPEAALQLRDGSVYRYNILQSKTINRHITALTTLEQYRRLIQTPYIRPPPISPVLLYYLLTRGEILLYRSAQSTRLRTTTIGKVASYVYPPTGQIFVMGNEV